MVMYVIVMRLLLLLKQKNKNATAIETSKTLYSKHKHLNKCEGTKILYITIFEF